MSDVSIGEISARPTFPRLRPAIAARTAPALIAAPRPRLLLPAPPAYQAQRRADARAARMVLWAEFTALYISVPLMLAFAMRPVAMWPMLVGSMLFALLILNRSPEFSWSSRLRAPQAADWRGIWIVSAGAVVLTLGFVLSGQPEKLADLPREAPRLWLGILIIYPIFSVLPQELIFRVLFFERYARLFPSDRAVALANGACFALAHLFFWNWPAVIMTFIGGVAFSVLYQKGGRSRGLAAAIIAHALSGIALFSLGLSSQFSHGMIPP